HLTEHHIARQRVELRGCLQLRRSRLKAKNQEGKLLGTAHPVAAILE
uniref:Uncharacterized protein n=1 Tax=Aegilops tauschii subsp. strangulata TaxID=200361 RepID=A0A452Y7Q6_AEGTS